MDKLLTYIQVIWTVVNTSNRYSGYILPIIQGIVIVIIQAAKPYYRHCKYLIVSGIDLKAKIANIAILAGLYSTDGILVDSSNSSEIFSINEKLLQLSQS